MRIKDPGQNMWHWKCRLRPHQNKENFNFHFDRQMSLMHNNLVPKRIWEKEQQQSTDPSRTQCLVIIWLYQWSQISKIFIKRIFVLLIPMVGKARGSWGIEDERNSHILQEVNELIAWFSICSAFADANYQPSNCNIYSYKRTKLRTSCIKTNTKRFKFLICST